MPKCACGYPFVPWTHPAGVRITTQCRECWRLFHRWEERMRARAADVLEETRLKRKR